MTDIEQAKEEFNALSRQLTLKSQENLVSGATTRAPSDVEKAEKSSPEEPFDLREYLTTSNDAQQQAGIKHKHVGVTWDNLEVKVAGGLDSKLYVGTFGGACLDFFLTIPLYIWSQIFAPLLSETEAPTRTILHKQSGMLKSGEMCLVLGCPGSGCTTFLKAIANDRNTFFGGEVVFNQEDDIHIATLTVAQTLAFALSTKTPGPNGRLAGVSRKEFDAEVQDMLLRMLNIQHTKQTLVGDEFVRGVSGGERKRVSIAEMMTTRARVQAWDNSTRGLDASTALDFVKCLRIMTDVLGQTTFVTLYQAGEGMSFIKRAAIEADTFPQAFMTYSTRSWSCLKAGKCISDHLRRRVDISKASDIRPSPRQSTADYLTGCTDPNERQFAPGRSARDTPSTPEALEAAFQSQFSRTLDGAREKYKLLMETEREDADAFRAAVAADKKKGVSKKSPYTLGFTGQVRALTIRQFQMRMQDKFQLYTSFTLSTVLSIVLGAAFFNLPPTSAGAFTRGGVIFAALLTTCLDAFGELASQMLGRPILRKQTGYSMYRPSAIAVANTLADIPFSAARVLLFNIPVYFMSNLSRTAGGFWTFHLFNYVAFLMMQGFFRTFGVLCTNFWVAFRLSVFFIPNFIEYTGYIIPVIKMKRWLFWIYYVNPIAYAWQACMENEFMRLQLTCDGTYIIPRNVGGLTKYPDGLGPNQACTLFGSNPGDSSVFGESYISAGYGLNSVNLWRLNFLVLIAFMFLFQLTQILALEFFPSYEETISVQIHAKEDDDAKRRNEVLRARKADKGKTTPVDSAKPLQGENGPEPAGRAPKKILTWSGLNYHVPVPGGTRRLLHDVQGYVGPGLTALMGASGAGKTTCLDVLAQRKNIGVVSGEILLGGRPLASDFARGTAYAEQMDVHEGTATVREALRFSAYLRQPAEVSKEEKDDYVEELLELLELQDLSEALIFSLSAESRKRVTIGVELASKPELLLYLDEPTSGLDSQSAWNIVRFLRKLADQGQAILCTIHQPSALLFESFDRLLLLERGGETVYFGDIGKDSCVLRDYFAANGAVCPPNMNPAEYMLEAIGAGTTPRVGDRDWKDIWLDSAECARVRDEIASIKRQGLAQPEPEKKTESTYATSFLYQLRIVTARNNLSLWRSPDYLFSRLFVCGFISLFISLSFLQLGTGVRDLQFRVFSIFWVSILPAIIMTQIEPLFISNRRIFIREASSRIYSPFVFAIAQTISELANSAVCGVVYWVLMVYPQGFGQGAAAGTNGTGFQLLITLIMMLFGVSFGQLIAAISPSVQVAALFNPFMSLVLTTFLRRHDSPRLERFLGIPWTWLYQLVPYTRSLAAMVSTELHGLKIQCKSDEFATFNPPANNTCAQWAQDFVNVAGGYLDNGNDTTDCRYCTYAVGDEFYTPLGISYSHRWRDAFIFLAFVGFNMILTIIASRFLRYAKR
ncbi:Pleiotropic drug resistance ABC transporter protein [Mycena sanguinolenta]|uniref:Pleiotropic drug resistance ABC transporter protein n=1 Tax=Mycena sanguinolenta TaxID=230812 RepID=A0A8H6XBR3_9AGAR|nr:Pleiotropic drug resistance ABC transporter protein [Mycena sanguinolenta]